MMEDLLEDDQKTFSDFRYFAICESCYWSATILGMKEGVACPMCTDSNVSMIPITTDEQYRMKLDAGSGLELSFSKRSS